MHLEVHQKSGLGDMNRWRGHMIETEAEAAERKRCTLRQFCAPMRENLWGASSGMPLEVHQKSGLGDMNRWRVHMIETEAEAAERKRCTLRQFCAPMRENLWGASSGMHLEVHQKSELGDMNRWRVHMMDTEAEAAERKRCTLRQFCAPMRENLWGASSGMPLEVHQKSGLGDMNRWRVHMIETEAEAAERKRCTLRQFC